MRKLWYFLRLLFVVAMCTMAVFETLSNSKQYTHKKV